jgi:hypothetical protein
MAALQLFAIISTLIVFVVNAMLAMLLAKFYIKNKKNISYLIWSSGLRFFAIAIILEILFAFGVYSTFLAQVYLFAITMPLLAFSIGHIQFVKNNRIKRYYYYYSVLFSLLLLYSLFSSSIGSIYSNYIVYGNLPLFPFVATLIITVSSAAVLFGVAISYYIKTKRAKMLAIIPGVVAFCIVNILHFQVLQLFAYYIQLLGVLLIWLGFIGFIGIKEYGPGI